MRRLYILFSAWWGCRAKWTDLQLSQQGATPGSFGAACFWDLSRKTPQKLLEPMNTTAYWKDGKLEMPVNRARTR